jgi:membrane protease YdiL (CAAX protease family)
MSIPGDAATPGPVRPRRFPVAILILALGAIFFLVGVGLLLALRLAPELGPLLPAPRVVIVMTMVLGGFGIVAGMSGLILGWGTSSGNPLPKGSHRSVIVSTVAPLALAVVASVAFFALAPDMGSVQTPVFIVAGLTMYGALLIVIYIQGVRSGLMTLGSLGLQAEMVPRALLWGAAGAGGTVLVGVANEFVLRAFGLPQPQAEAFEWLRGLPVGHFVIVALGGAVIAPIVEELFFRGYVFNAYLAEKGIPTAYVGSAAIFGVVHGLPTLFLGIFSMGLVLAFLYRRSGSIIAPVIAHLLNNTLAFISLFATLHG